MPIFFRKKIANKIRVYSDISNKNKSKTMMDVYPQIVKKMILHHDVHWMIHGHTHQSAIHRLCLTNGMVYRYVLGAWDTHGSIIKISTTTFELISFLI